MVHRTCVYRVTDKLQWSPQFSHTKSMKKLLKTRKWALWDLLYFFVEAFSPIINIDWDIILQKFLVRYHRKFTPVFCMSLVKFCQQISTKNLVLGLKKKKKPINIIIHLSPCNFIWPRIDTHSTSNPKITISLFFHPQHKTT